MVWYYCYRIPYKPKIFEINNQEFYYDSLLGGFIFPEDDGLNIDQLIKDILNDDVLDVSDWELKKISNIPNPKYIKNHYTRGDGSSLYVCTPDYPKDLIGDWLLENRDQNVSMEFSVSTKNNQYEDGKRIFLAYPEKTEIPYDPEKIINKSNFILFILWMKQLLKIS
jgi:hypothetical protein